MTSHPNQRSKRSIIMELDGRLLGSDFFLPHVSLACLGQPKPKGKVSDEKRVKSRENSDNDPKRNVNCFVTCPNRLPSPPPRNHPHPQLTGYFFSVAWSGQVGVAIQTSGKVDEKQFPGILLLKSVLRWIRWTKKTPMMGGCRVKWYTCTS